jgi:hypothetical protein
MINHRNRECRWWERVWSIWWNWIFVWNILKCVKIWPFVWKIYFYWIFVWKFYFYWIFVWNMLNVWKYDHLCENLTFIGYLCEICSMFENMAIYCENVTFIRYWCEICSMCENMAVWCENATFIWYCCEICSMCENIDISFLGSICRVCVGYDVLCSVWWTLLSRAIVQFLMNKKGDTPTKCVSRI